MILGLTERIRVKLQNDKYFAELAKGSGIAFVLKIFRIIEKFNVG